MYNLNGKVALVTGAAGPAGLGRAIALRLAQEGADLVVNDLREDHTKRHGLPDTVAAIQALGKRSLAVYADVADPAQVDRMVSQALDQFGRVDILVNNAGAPAGSDRVPVVELDEDAFDRVIRVNLRGTFLCCRAVARSMIARDEGGKIINIASTAGKYGVARYAAYCASKFAVRGFTQSLASELAPYQINVNAVCPGLIATERIDDMAAALAPAGTAPADQRREMIQSAIRSAPLQRLTETRDVANMTAFLASDESAFITGQSLTVDGGLHMD